MIYFIALIVSDFAISRSNMLDPISHHCSPLIFEHFLLSGITWYFRFFLYFLCLRCWINHFPRESWFLLLENAFRTQDLCLKFADRSEVSWFLGSFGIMFMEENPFPKVSSKNPKYLPVYIFLCASMTILGWEAPWS